VRPSATKTFIDSPTKPDWRSTHQRLPLLCPVAGLLGKLPLGSEQRVFARFEFAGGQLPQEASGGMAILALDHNPGVALAFRVVDGQDDGAAVVANDVARGQLATRLDEAVAHHMEERPSKTVSELSSSAVSSAAA